jgi:hypothetical protein
VVLVTVDQLRPDYFDRFGAQLTGGLGWIRTHSVFFPLAHQEHATTETAPGHATLLSGREPVHTNIVTNGKGVPDADAPLLDAQGTGASPRRFHGTTLVDWLRAKDPETRVLSVSRKDRGAILPVGRAKADVYWWADGRFTTSRYYADSLPRWLRSYNARVSHDLLPKLAGLQWTLLLPDSAYHEIDAMPFENGGDDFVFPHRLPTRPGDVARQLERFPAMDSVTLDLALEGVRSRGLGTRRSPDILAISLSTTDAVGHDFGPDSRELHDQVLRVDRLLGSFLDSLATLVPRERTVFVLAADHGVTSMPEYSVLVRHQRAGRVWLGDLARAATEELEGRYHTSFDIAFDSGMLTADLDALRAKGVNVDSLATALAAEAVTHPGVLRVYTARTLAAAPASDEYAERWRRTLPDGFGWLICAVPEQHFVFDAGRLRAEHGNAGIDDVGIPIGFVVPGLRPATVRRVVRSVDIAPTLAALLDVTPVEPLDGQKLPEVIESIRTTSR